VNISLLIGAVFLAIGIGMVVFLRPTPDGEPRILRNSSWSIVFPVVPLFFLTFGGAELIRAFS
jgi:hypothetical protein